MSVAATTGRQADDEYLRQRVLREIKRIAAESAGRAPGVDVFARETGISNGQWLGKVWARWSDALREAGFTPNELQRKLDSDFVLSKIAEACVHYGRWPSAADVKIFGRSDPGFPNYKTVEHHFLTRAGLLDAFREWASGQGRGDLLEMLPAPTARPVGSQSARVSGLVYLLKSGAFYKIGRSDQIERRVKEIRVSFPEAAKLVHSIETDDPSGIEAYWHRRFEKRRANGEWFKLTSDDLAAFRRRRYQ